MSNEPEPRPTPQRLGDGEPRPPHEARPQEESRPHEAMRPRPGGDHDAAAVPRPVRTAAAWTWRLLLLGFGAVVLGWLFKRFEDITVPIALALLFAALLKPPMERAVRRGVPRAAAAVLTVVIALVVVAGVLAFVVQQTVAHGAALVNEFAKTVDDIRHWLSTGPLHIDSDGLHSLTNELVHWAKEHEGSLADSALGTASFASRMGAGTLLTIFLLLFFLYDGGAMWRYVTRLIPRTGRERVRGAGAAGFRTVEQYVRATVLVAAVDAAIIGVGLGILRVPLALPLVVVIFLGAFVPIVGSFVAGSLAVIVSLSTQGWVHAVIVLAILVFVMAFEGHVLQPFVLGTAVKLHPVAVILAIALGIMLAGIIGGILAVPFVAFLDTAATWHPGREPTPPKESRFTAWLRRRFQRGGAPDGPAASGSTASDAATPPESDRGR